MSARRPSGLNLPEVSDEHRLPLNCTTAQSQLFPVYRPVKEIDVVRCELCELLWWAACQRLLPDVTPGSKRHLAVEVLWNTNPISIAIRNNKIESIDNYLLTNRDEGMLSFDESVRVLLKAGKITRQVAEHNVRDVALLNR